MPCDDCEPLRERAERAEEDAKDMLVKGADYRVLARRLRETVSERHEHSVDFCDVCRLLASPEVRAL